MDLSAKHVRHSMTPVHPSALGESSGGASGDGGATGSFTLPNPITVSYVSHFKPHDGLRPTLATSDGSLYFGDMDTNTCVPHGNGVMLFRYDVSAYGAGVAPYRCRRLATLSTSTFYAGDRYAGAWRRGQFEGWGVLVSSSFSYEGNWKEGKPHGRGSISYSKSYVDRMPDSGGLFDGNVGTVILRGLSYLSPFDLTSLKPREYVGDFDQVHLRHGTGTMRYYNGDVYEGSWFNNRRHGEGTLQSADGERYCGQWERDMRHGCGRVDYPNGSYYKGMMHHNTRDGGGVMSFANGDEYFGNFARDHMSGHGTMRYRNGDVYEGEWRHDTRHGYGRFTLKKNGVTMEGNFVKGLTQGLATVVYPGVSTFVGSFDRGERTSGTLFWHPPHEPHAQGDEAGTTAQEESSSAPASPHSTAASTSTNTTTTSTTVAATTANATTAGAAWVATGRQHGGRLCYQGEWQGEHMHGKGLLWFINGSFFYGDFVKSRRTGKGNMRYANGVEYSGDFVDDVRHGWGVQQQRNGLVSVGRWRSDAFVEGYYGEWDGRALNGIGYLTLSSENFFGLSVTHDAHTPSGAGGTAHRHRSRSSHAHNSRTDKASHVEEAHSATDGEGGGEDSAAAARRGRPCANCVHFLGIFANGYRDGVGMMWLPETIASDAELTSSSHHHKHNKNHTKHDERIAKHSNSPSRRNSKSLPIATADHAADNRAKQRHASLGALDEDHAEQGTGAGTRATHQPRHHLLKGRWCADELHCPHGVWLFPSGAMYAGGFLHGQREGPCGRLWSEDGSVYVGGWRDNAPHGRGGAMYLQSSSPCSRRWCGTAANTFALTHLTRTEAAHAHGPSSSRLVDTGRHARSSPSSLSPSSSSLSSSSLSSRSHSSTSSTQRSRATGTSSASHHRHAAASGGRRGGRHFLWNVFSSSGSRKPSPQGEHEVNGKAAARLTRRGENCVMYGDWRSVALTASVYQSCVSPSLMRLPTTWRASRRRRSCHARDASAMLLTTPSPPAARAHTSLVPSSASSPVSASASSSTAVAARHEIFPVSLGEVPHTVSALLPRGESDDDVRDTFVYHNHPRSHRIHEHDSDTHENSSSSSSSSRKDAFDANANPTRHNDPLSLVTQSETVRQDVDEAALLPVKESLSTAPPTGSAAEASTVQPGVREVLTWGGSTHASWTVEADRDGMMHAEEHIRQPSGGEGGDAAAAHVTVGVCSGVGVVFFASGVVVRSRWHGNREALLTPHRPRSFYDYYMRWVRHTFEPSTPTPSMQSRYTAVIRPHRAAQRLWDITTDRPADRGAANASSAATEEDNNDEVNDAKATSTLPPLQCSFCARDFSYFRGATCCALCFRASCAACLRTMEMQNNNNNSSSSSRRSSSRTGSNDAATCDPAIRALVASSATRLRGFTASLPPPPSSDHAMEGTVAVDYTHTDSEAEEDNTDDAALTRRMLPAVAEGLSAMNAAAAAAHVYAPPSALSSSSASSSPTAAAHNSSVAVCADCLTAVSLRMRWCTAWLPRAYVEPHPTTPPQDAKSGHVRTTTNATATATVVAASYSHTPNTKHSPPQPFLASSPSWSAPHEPDEVAERGKTHAPSAPRTTPMHHSTNHSTNHAGAAAADTESAPLQERQQTSTLVSGLYTQTTRWDAWVIYRGYTAAGLPHGCGEMWWGRQHYYRGGFVHGQRHGYGIQRMFNGEHYTGGFAHNRWHGDGYYACEDGSVLHARFEHGRLGVLYYHGEVDARRRAHGCGVGYAADGSVYNGSWQHGVRQGSGLLQYPDGSVYLGAVSENVPHGYGKWVTAQGAFHGHFARGQREGAGVEFVADGAVRGEWRGGVLHGGCRLYDALTGEVYETTYAHGNERDDCFTRPIMLDDREMDRCAGCGAGFGFFLRRHHCRLCGEVFCDACTTRRAVMPAHFYTDAARRTPTWGDDASLHHTASLPAVATPRRVCEGCYVRLQQRRMLALRRYRNGAVYAGCWSGRRWVSRGLYCRRDGVCVVMDDHGQPILPPRAEEGGRRGVQPRGTPTTPPGRNDKAVGVNAAEEHQATSTTDGSTSASLAAANGESEVPVADATPEMHILDALPTTGSTMPVLDSFVMWWGSMMNLCHLHVALDIPLLHQHYRRHEAEAGTASPSSSSSSPSPQPSTARAATQRLMAFPVAPETPSPALFVSLHTALRESDCPRYAQSASQCGDATTAAATVRAARFMPALIPPCPALPTMAMAERRLLSSSCAGGAVADEEEFGVAAERRLSAAFAPSCADYDLPLTDVFAALRAERQQRFGPTSGSKGVTAIRTRWAAGRPARRAHEHGVETNLWSATSTTGAAVEPTPRDNTAEGVVGDHASHTKAEGNHEADTHHDDKDTDEKEEEEEVPYLLPPTPAPPPLHRHVRVEWDSWSVQPLPVMCGVVAFSVPHKRDGATASSPLPWASERRWCGSCALWQPVVPAWSAVLRGGRRAWRRRRSTRTKELPRASMTFETDVRATTTKQKAVPAEEELRGWLPQPMSGPYHFEVADMPTAGHGAMDAEEECGRTVSGCTVYQRAVNAT